ncbi:MAG: TIGR01777 family oxidoreductase [Pseudomonadota bacterium]
MHVLITGGTGFIGRALCKQLFQAGHASTVLTRSRTPPPLPGVRFIASLDEAEGIEAVVNLAGEPLADGRWNAARKQAFRDSRIGTTQKLLAWMESLPKRPRVLVSGSAIGYYGASDDRLLAEMAPAGEDFAATLCRDWETEALKARALGLRVCTLRIGIVLGADGGALARMLPPFKLGAGGPMGSGAQWMSWVRRSDLVNLIGWLLGNEAASGPYNGTAPKPVTNREFARTLGAVLKRPAVMTMPTFVLKLIFGEMAESLLLTGQRVVPSKAEAEGFVFEHRELEPALRDLLR